MKKILIAAVLAGTFLTVRGADPVTVFQTDFNSKAEYDRWSNTPERSFDATGGRNGSGAVKFTLPQESSGLSTLDIPVDELRGCGVVLEGWMRGEKLVPPKISYLGPKLMMIVETENTQTYPDQTKQYDSFDWKKFNIYTRIPRDVTKLSLAIGLQGTTGTLWIDDVKLLRLDPPGDAKLSPANQLRELQKEPRFRGVMSGGDWSEDAFRTLADYGVNLMRFQISKSPGEDNVTEQGFRNLVNRSLQTLDRVLPLARKYNINMLIDMHFGAGTVATKLLSNELSWEPAKQQLLIDVWREIAEKYKDEPIIWGYDLLNEPRENNYTYIEGNSDWNGLAERIARAIREVDPQKRIIVESTGWGSPADFPNLRPIDLPNIVYSFHFYAPGEFTHQGVHNRPRGIRYPGVIAGREWNREELRKAVQPVIDFQKKYRVPVYVGEFGAARWAPGAEQYFDDLISIFEENGWDWTYHAFREWDGWSFEHSSDFNDNKRSDAMNPRKAVLLKYFKKNNR